MDSEESLLAAAIAGEVESLSALLGRHAPQLRAQLQIDSRWQSVLDVDDVLQVTFLEAFQRIGRFVPAGPGALLAWLSRIADNNLRDAIKGLSRKKRPPPAVQTPARADESVVDFLALLGVTTSTPSRAFANEELLSSLEVALKALPEDYAQAVRAYDLEGRSIAETSELMGRRPGAVHMLRARAHGRLRELLGANPFLSVSL